MSSTRFVSGTVLLAILTVSAGCAPSGPPIGAVTGTVTLDGQPLDGAYVQFDPKTDKAEAGSSHGLTDPSGRYTLSWGSTRKGAYLGEHTVTITHASYGNDKLSASVVAGENTIDFPLQRLKGSKPPMVETFHSEPLQPTVK